MLIIDSDVLIDHLRGSESTARFLLKQRKLQPLTCSVVSETELIAGMTEQERQATLRLFDVVKPIAISSPIARLAGDYRRKYGKSHGVLLPDALIAATANIHRGTLVTRNVKHYPMSDIDIRQPL